MRLLFVLLFSGISILSYIFSIVQLLILSFIVCYYLYKRAGPLKIEFLYYYSPPSNNVQIRCKCILYVAAEILKYPARI